MFAQLIVRRSNFVGAVRVDEGIVQFQRRAVEDRPLVMWFHLVSFQNNGQTWSLDFGRYGKFTVRKGLARALDLELGRRVLEQKSAKGAKAVEVEPEEQPKKAARRPKPVSEPNLRAARTTYRYLTASQETEVGIEWGRAYIKARINATYTAWAKLGFKGGGNTLSRQVAA